MDQQDPLLPLFGFQLLFKSGQRFKQLVPLFFIRPLVVVQFDPSCLTLDSYCPSCLTLDSYCPSICIHPIHPRFARFFFKRKQRLKRESYRYLYMYPGNPVHPVNTVTIQTSIRPSRNAAPSSLPVRCEPPPPLADLINRWLVV